MHYYYAHTGHKGNLDALRRGVAYAKKQISNAIPIKILVNDFRAGLVARELGFDDVTTIETISDIDYVLEFGDSVVIDSTEELPLRFKKYCDNFKVSIISFGGKDPLYNENIIDISKKENLLIDDVYKKEYKKTKRVLFFGGDSDYTKSILAQKEFFKNLKSDLLLGHYFFVNYEKEIKDFFVNLYESEEYIEVITTSSDIITTSLQCAIESKNAGANVVFITTGKLNPSISNLLENINIAVLYEYDLSKATNLLSKNI
ncbi:MAG: hypothetical protein IE880_07395 [Epsilonproteobacteria bacterium]|nr:hypothetical protein [Campylobacterota bacterium]